MRTDAPLDQRAEGSQPMSEPQTDDQPMMARSPSLTALLDLCSQYMSDDDLALIHAAYQVAAAAHAGIKRRSGEPFIEHTVAVAGILAELAMDAQGIAAALLHDTVEDTTTTLDGLREQFGPVIAAIVDGVTKFDAVEAPRDGDSKITNTPDNLVASLRRRIRGRSVDLERDIQAYRALTGSDECGSDDEDDDKDKDDDKKFPWDKDSRRRTAAEATTDSRVLDPPLSGTDDQDIKGHDFTDVELVSDSTQPKDASVRAFAAFDDWMRATTGRSATAHHPNFVRRQAARYAEASGVPLQAMFPALEVFLRRARRAEVDRREAMDRRANESLEVAAPDERVDVEAPVNDTTDQRAQQSQYDIGEFGQNAGDSVAKPDLSTNSQIWAPGEGGGTSDREERAASFNRKADAVAAVRYAEAYINSGLPYEDKWQLVAQAQQMRHATIVDRTRLLEAVAQANATRARSASRRLAAASGAAGRIPPGLTSPRTAPSNVRYAATDPSNDSALFI